MTSFNSIHSKSIYFPSFLWFHFSLELNNIPPHICKNFHYPLIEVQLGWFHFLATVKGTKINVRVQISQWYSHTFSMYEANREIAGSISNILRKLQTDLHNAYFNLHSHQQWMRVLFFSHPLQHLLPNFLIIFILNGVRWYLKVALICISWWLSYVEYAWK